MMVHLSGGDLLRVKTKVLWFEEPCFIPSNYVNFSLHATVQNVSEHHSFPYLMHLAASFKHEADFCIPSWHWA
jgi:hypothetical protein